ncbi:MAG TPA: hypothetical protein V6C91_08245 [Coleofasciculaceae cyanobacterium]
MSDSHSEALFESCLRHAARTPKGRRQGRMSVSMVRKQQSADR